MHRTRFDDSWFPQSAVKLGQRTFHWVWQPGGGFDRNLHNRDAIRRAIEYIEYNPVRRGLVRGATEREYSSARARMGATNVLVPIDEYDEYDG